MGGLGWCWHTGGVKDGSCYYELSSQGSQVSPCPHCLPAGMQEALVAELSAGLQPVWAAADTTGRRGAADAFAGARAVVGPVGAARVHTLRRMFPAQ